MFWTPPKRLVQMDLGAKITRRTLSLLSIMAVVCSVDVGNFVSTVSLLAAATVSGQTIWQPAPSTYLALIQLARMFRLSLTPTLHSAASRYIAICAYAALAWKLLLPAYQRQILRHVRGMLFLDSFAFIRLCSKRSPTYDDIVDPEACEQANEAIKKLHFDTGKKYFVIRGLLAVTWKHTVAIFVLETVFSMAPYYKSIVLAKILEAVDHGAGADRSHILGLWILWSLLSLSSIGDRYLGGLKNTHSHMSAAILRSKLLSSFATRHDNPEADDLFFKVFWLKMHEIVGSVPMILNILSRTLANAVNIWILSTKVGWRSVIPVAVALIYSFVSQCVTVKKDAIAKQSRIKRQPRFYTNYATMIDKMRTIKFYGWERAFHNAGVYVADMSTALPIVWRLLSLFIGLVGGSISQVAAALTVISYLKTANALTYPEVLLVVSSTQALSELIISSVSTSQMLRSLHKSEELFETLIRKPEQAFLEYSPPSLTTAVELHGCEFQWGEDKFRLKPVTLSVAAGELVVVMGCVGSGKSSLMSALCGHMELTGGKGCLYGRIGYVSQKPWIMNATFRENVLFGHEFDEKFYWRVIEACALSDDIKLFPAQDLSEIGPRGINLSGGQKARLALARAIYSRADVYILDDILAAVDAYVERHIVSSVLVGSGIISDKARILVTHSEHVAPLANKVIVVADGNVEVVDQTPTAVSASPPQLPTQPDGDASSDSDKDGQGRFATNPEEDTLPFEWSHVWKYLALSGYGVIAASFMIQAITAYAIFYVENLRMDLLSDRNRDTMMQSLQQYLVVNALVDIFRVQIHHVEVWIRRRIWTQHVSEVTRVALLNLMLYMPLPLLETLPQYVTNALFYRDRNCLAILLPQILSSKVEIIFNAGYTMISVSRRLPVIFLFALPIGLISYLVKHLCEAANASLWKVYVSNRLYSYHNLAGEINDGRVTMQLNGVVDIYVKKCSAQILTNWLWQSKNSLSGMLVGMVHNMGITIMNSAVLFFNIWRSLDPRSTLTPGEIDMMLRLSDQFLNCLRQLLNLEVNLDTQLPTLARYYAYQELPREPTSDSDIELPENWPSGGAIEFRDYNMRYRENLDLVLEQVSFAVRRQEKVGIVGRTGAGKSSLTHALLRMVESVSGVIFIDGVDISRVGLRDLRSKISIIPQDPALFVGTIRENLDPLNEFTDDEVWTAIRKGHIEDLVCKPTQRYNTDDEKSGPWVAGVGLDKWVEAGGRNFSVGQRQLVSLCRALLWKRKILVLDEATANVDTKTDQIMQQVIRKEFSDCTILTIAHRLRTVMDSDRILVMDQGKVVEFDSPANLLAQDSLFKSLVESMELSEQN
ncbi:Canalicular multispecific organic anion transporter 1 [Linderina macrospora]|uniref:Canalicular multispecific organic anion transporter 1 n=1 Tax=Linderina macrospora TaxID=4868 RepID=A0ACC1JG57_9FUNG|nr:Canalicular multispecific organic anion transporter 1 [Linderina macrospora]